MNNSIKDKLSFIDSQIDYFEKQKSLLEKRIDFLNDLHKDYGDFYIDKKGKIYTKSLKISECSRMDILPTMDYRFRYLKFSKACKDTRVKGARVYLLTENFSDTNICQIRYNHETEVNDITIFPYLNFFKESNNKEKWVDRIQLHLLNLVRSYRNVNLIENETEELQNLKTLLVLC